MQIPGLPFRVSRVKTKVSEHAHYGLTPLGKIKAEGYSLSGAEGEVIAAIEDDNDMVPEICNATKFTPEKVKWVIKRLIRKGYVQQLRED
jgi:DNA-binding MarR family transcriptional regulator